MAYSEILLKLFQDVCNAETYSERRDALMSLATQYAKDHDDTDVEVLDSFHELVEEFEVAHQALTHSALRLGRAVVEILEADENVHTVAVTTSDGSATDLN